MIFMGPDQPVLLYESTCELFYHGSFCISVAKPVYLEKPQGGWILAVASPGGVRAGLFVLTMSKRSAKSSSAAFVSEVGKRYVKKTGGTLQAAKWNASLASKIKTKLMNNSSLFKASLQQNNKALALALNREKENSRKLKNEKIFLQMEVEKLQFHNIFLCHKLNCLNKILVGIKAYLNDNLLTAIEVSSLSENLQSSLHRSADPSSPTVEQFKSACQSSRSVELPVKLPLILRANAKEQGSPPLGEIPNYYKCTTNFSKEMRSDQVKLASSLPSGTNNQKLIEIDPVETAVDKQILKENLLCTEVSCISAFLTCVKNKQSLEQPEELTEQYNGSSLPSYGNVAETEKHAVLPKSKHQSNIKDFDEKCKSFNLPHHGTNSGSNTNDTNLQEGSSDLSCVIPSPRKFSNESETDFKKLLFTDKMKPEETLYDDDMELTASDVGELLTVTAKDNRKLRQNKSSNANSGKILASFRKAKYSKKDKKEVKSKTEVSSNLYAEERHTRAGNSEASKTIDSQTQQFQSQSEQSYTGNSVEKQSKTSTAKATRRTYQVNLMSPRKQKTNKETFSKTFGVMKNKIQKADSNLSANGIPPEVCAEKLPFQDNTSNMLPLQEDFLNTNDKDSRPTVNRKTFQNPSKANTAKYHREENGQCGEYIFKKSQTKIHQHESKRKQDQKNTIQIKNNQKSGYRESRETENYSTHETRQKADQNSSHFLPGRLKHTLAKAGQKAHIIPKENLTQFSVCKSEELKNKDSLHAEAVSGNKVTKTQQIQVALITLNGAATNTPEAKEANDADMLKKVNSSAVANRNPHISNSHHQMNQQKQSSDVTKTRQEKIYFRRIDQGEQNILDDQEVPHEIDSFPSKLKPMIQVECSKNMPLNVDRFSQEGLSNIELPAVNNHNASINFSMLKTSEIHGENGHNKALDAEKAEQNLDHLSKGSYKSTLTSSHGRRAFQDVTNTRTQSHTSVPKSPEASGENSAAPSRRERHNICYREPNLL
ncbi:PREDICTED: shugoshin-like 2, partial [Acanthisitta chloris]